MEFQKDYLNQIEDFSVLHHWFVLFLDKFLLTLNLRFKHKFTHKDLSAETVKTDKDIYFKWTLKKKDTERGTESISNTDGIIKRL